MIGITMRMIISNMNEENYDETDDETYNDNYDRNYNADDNF